MQHDKGWFASVCCRKFSSGFSFSAVKTLLPTLAIILKTDFSQRYRRSSSAYEFSRPKTYRGLARNFLRNVSGTIGSLIVLKS